MTSTAAPRSEQDRSEQNAKILGSLLSIQLFWLLVTSYWLIDDFGFLVGLLIILPPTVFFIIAPMAYDYFWIALPGMAIGGAAIFAAQSFTNRPWFGFLSGLLHQTIFLVAALAATELISFTAMRLSAHSQQLMITHRIPAIVSIDDLPKKYRYRHATAQLNELKYTWSYHQMRFVPVEDDS
ncbi:MAG: hypothetical protein KTR21_13505 [Rhodobacteraceae bacterium]|nr:hypothetical protein [Paracoccaceae bacterium]